MVLHVCGTPTHSVTSCVGYRCLDCTYIKTYIYVHIYIYIYINGLTCVWHTHTQCYILCRMQVSGMYIHKHIYTCTFIYTYINIYMVLHVCGTPTHSVTSCVGCRCLGCIPHIHIHICIYMFIYGDTTMCRWI